MRSNCCLSNDDVESLVVSVISLGLCRRLHLGCILGCSVDLVGSIFLAIGFGLRLSTCLPTGSLVTNGLDLKSS